MSHTRPANLIRRLRSAWITTTIMLGMAVLLTTMPNSGPARAQPCGQPRPFSANHTGSGGCANSTPAVSRLRMSPTARGPAQDYFLDGSEAVFIAFDYTNIGEGDNIRLLVRDVNGVPLLDHAYENLAGSGTKQVILTGRDAVDGLTRSGLDAGNSIARYTTQALLADSRFQMAPLVERAIFAATTLQSAIRSLRTFQVGDEADAHLTQAQTHIQTTIEAGRTALNPTIGLDAAKELVATARDEAQRTTLAIAEAHAAIRSERLTFPETVDCSFYLTNVYLNKAPVASIEWTVGTPDLPAYIHPPQVTRQFGVLHIQPLIIYTQEVTLAEVPHTTTITGRVVDMDCRPVADGTWVTLSLNDPTLGSLSPPTVMTTAGYFTSTLQTTENLGNGVVTVHAQAGVAEGMGTVFLVGPPANLTIDIASPRLTVGESTALVVQVRDARGQPVADGTEVVLSLSPPALGSLVPERATTSDGLVLASLMAGNVAGTALVTASAGQVTSTTTVEIVEPATTTPTPMPTPTPTRTATPTPAPTATPACDSSDPEQLCNGVVSVRVFEDPRCDGHFNNGVDRALLDISVNLVYPDGTTIHTTTDPNGYAVFGQVHLRGDEQVALLVEYPAELVMTGLTPCNNSGTLKFLRREDFGPFATASVTFRAYRQIVTRRGILQTAEVSLCFTAQYYLEPTDGGEVVYLVTDQDLSAYLGTEVKVTGSTWELEFCRYLFPISISPVP